MDRLLRDQGWTTEMRKAGVGQLGGLDTGQWTLDRFQRDQGWMTEMRKAGVGQLGGLDTGQVPKGPGLDDRDEKGRCWSCGRTVDTGHVDRALRDQGWTTETRKAGAGLVGRLESGHWKVDRFLRDQGLATEMRKAGVGSVGEGLDTEQWTGS